MDIKDNPKSATISVAMCTYNGERYLQEQLKSIGQQTLLPYELIVCDDGSVDATPAIISAFALTSPFPVKFIRNPENLGSTKNFEEAIRLCDGEFIALCDQDDVWLPDKLARQSDVLRNNPELGGVFSDARIINNLSEKTGKRLWAEFFFTPRRQRRFKTGRQADVMLRGNIVTGATLMIRANLRPLLLPIPPICLHDFWIAWMIILYSKLEFIPSCLVLYRVHDRQQIGAGHPDTPEYSSLRKRLMKARNDDASKHAREAQELDALQSAIAKTDDSKVGMILPSIQVKSAFLKKRACLRKTSISRLFFILRNIDSYNRYDRGWKCFLRDIVSSFV